VLVADDDRDSADSCVVLLQSAGHDVRSAYSGAEALIAAASFHPQMAFLDIAMPQMNGYDVARTIRAAKWGREMVLVAVTGWGRAADKRRASESGFDHHLVKPFDFKTLQALLAQCAGKSRDAGESNP
jgi:CheY-like chemotaxis protein